MSRISQEKQAGADGFLKCVIFKGLIVFGLLVGTLVLLVGYWVLYGGSPDPNREFWDYWSDLIPGFIIAGVSYSWAKFRGWFADNSEDQ